MKPVVSQLLEFTIKCMEKVNIPLFFQFVSELLKWYHSTLSHDEMLLLLNTIVQRLQVDVEDNK